MSNEHQSSRDWGQSLVNPTPDYVDHSAARDAYARGRRDEQEALARVLPGLTYMDPPDGGSPTILEQFQRMAQDAERYREVAANQWVSVNDRMPPVGQQVVLWVYAERHGEDDDGRPYTVDVSGVHLGEYRDAGHGPYIDNYSTPFADVEGITHWMLPTPPRQEAQPAKDAEIADAMREVGNRIGH